MIGWTCYQPHFNQTHLWQLPLPQNVKCFLKFAFKLANWSTEVTSSSQLSQLQYFGSKSLYQSNCLAIMHWSFIGFFGDPKLAYTCAFWESFLNIDTNQRYLSKYVNMLVVLYGMANVACHFCFKLLLVYTFT